MMDDDTYEVPLQDQRVFGAGIKRQRVKFVPSTSSSSVTPAHAPTSATSASEFYLNLVMPKALQLQESSAPSSLPSPRPLMFADNGLPVIEMLEGQICEVCKLPLSSGDEPITIASGSKLQTMDDTAQLQRSKPRPHEASLAHQVCLQHSHPPSHLDRNRKGLAYLSTYGWNPDERKGLGAEGQGIQFPIKLQPKDDKLGIGIVLPKPEEIRIRKPPLKLDAGKVRKLQEKDKRRGEKLKDIFYRSEQVERYLAGG